MSMLVIVPARAESKRLPNKNKLRINGRTLTKMAYDIGREITLDDDYVVVTTDDEELLKDYKMNRLRRPKYLAQDDTPMISVALHVLAQDLYDYPNNILLLQPTSPERTVEMVQSAIDIFNANAFNALYSVGRDYEPNGAFYIIRTWHLLEQGTFTPADAFKLPAYDLVDIDTEDDFNTVMLRMGDDDAPYKHVRGGDVWWDNNPEGAE